MTDRASAHETTGQALALRVADLRGRDASNVHLRPDAEARAALAAELGVLRLRKLDFRATLTPVGRSDWRLDGVLGATVVQACVISAEPVTTRIDTPVIRRFLREMPQSDGPEAEIPEDDTIEPLGPVIDVGAVMVEALALALPDYPRAPGATLPDSVTDGGEDARPKPFAALKALKSDAH